MQNEKQLLHGLRRGESAAFTAFVDGYGGKIHGLSRRYARCEADAEDLTQEIFVDLYRCVAGFRGESSLSTWVYRVAMNHCLKHAGRRKPDSVSYDDTLNETPDLMNDPHLAAARGELRGKVGDALETLTDAHRDVVILHELHGLTYAECAQILNIPVGTVKSRLSHAFGKLRHKLGDYVSALEPAVLPTPRTEAA